MPSYGLHDSIYAAHMSATFMDLDHLCADLPVNSAVFTHGIHLPGVTDRHLYAYVKQQRPPYARRLVRSF
jgi:hypothetical protein